MKAIENFLLYNFAMDDYTARLAAMIFVGVCLFSLILRFLLCLAYNFTITGFNSFAKEAVKKKTDPRHMKSMLSSTTTKIIGEYMSIGEKGISNIDTRSIVCNRISKLGILGLSYMSVEEFVEKFEQASIFIGLVLALIYDFPLGFGTISISAFVIFRILAIFLNFKLIREQLTNDMIAYVDREIGPYYIGDLTSAVQRLKVELVVAITNQGNFMEKVMKDFEISMSKNMTDGMEQIANSVNFTMESLSKYSEFMDEPFNKWKEAVESSTYAQNSLYEALEHISTASQSFSQIQKNIETSLANFVLSSKYQTEAMTDMTEKLAQSSNVIIAKYDNIEVLNNTLSSQFEVFEKNQTLLDESIDKYEISLREITSSLSGAVGSIMGHHVEKAYYDLNDELKDNIKRITTSNTEVLNKIESFFEEILRFQNAKNQ